MDNTIIKNNSQAIFDTAENEVMQVVRRLQNSSKKEVTTFTSKDLKDLSDMLEFAVNDFKLAKQSKEMEDK